MGDGEGGAEDWDKPEVNLGAEGGDEDLDYNKSEGKGDWDKDGEEEPFVCFMVCGTNSDGSHVCGDVWSHLDCDSSGKCWQSCEEADSDLSRHEITETGNKDRIPDDDHDHDEDEV